MLHLKSKVLRKKVKEGQWPKKSGNWVPKITLSNVKISQLFSIQLFWKNKFTYFEGKNWSVDFLKQQGINVGMEINTFLFPAKVLKSWGSLYPAGMTFGASGRCLRADDRPLPFPLPMPPMPPMPPNPPRPPNKPPGMPPKPPRAGDPSEKIARKMRKDLQDQYTHICINISHALKLWTLDYKITPRGKKGK